MHGRLYFVRLFFIFMNQFGANETAGISRILCLCTHYIAINISPLQTADDTEQIIYYNNIHSSFCVYDGTTGTLSHRSFGRSSCVRYKNAYRIYFNNIYVCVLWVKNVEKRLFEMRSFNSWEEGDVPCKWSEKKDENKLYASNLITRKKKIKEENKTSFSYIYIFIRYC